MGGHEGGAAGHLKHHQGLVLVIAYERGTAVGFGYGFPRHRRCLRVLVPEPAGDKSGDRTPSEGTPDSPWQSQRFANRIRSRHALVHAMLEAGHSRRSIGRQLHMTHRTVTSLADAAEPEDLFRDPV
ncbi:hypothetical protein AB0B12_40600 [Streptomyces sp. NPDC044780]|uniref:hypothetical protein n=1 Tax=unclassified Streptomyces TaxID=2593676 RepID=UPI003400B7E3